MVIRIEINIFKELHFGILYDILKEVNKKPMIESTWEKPSLIPSNVTHRYLQDNFLRFWFDKLTEEEILKLQKKLEEIDEYMENPKNIENFFEDLESQWDFHKALAFHSGIQWVSYEWWEYGFFDEEGDPTLSDTQEIRVEYASKKMREALLQLSMNNTRGAMQDIL